MGSAWTELKHVQLRMNANENAKCYEYINQPHSWVWQIDEFLASLYENTPMCKGGGA